MITTEPTKIRHRVGECPACHCDLWAEVEIVTEVHAPTLDRDGKAHAYVNPRFTGMSITHHCERDDDGNWARTETTEENPDA